MVGAVTTRHPAAFSSLTASASMSIQSITFIGSLDRLSLETSNRRNATGAGAGRSVDPRQNAFGVHAALNSSVHNVPNGQQSQHRSLLSPRIASSFCIIRPEQTARCARTVFSSSLAD
ncbi:hypothetical protein ACNKHK_20140 [Shigella flexneri]